MKIEAGKKYNMNHPDKDVAYALILGKESDLGLSTDSEAIDSSGLKSPIYFGVIVYAMDVLTNTLLYRTSSLDTWCESGYACGYRGLETDLISEVDCEV